MLRSGLYIYLFENKPISPRRAPVGFNKESTFVAVFCSHILPRETRNRGWPRDRFDPAIDSAEDSFWGSFTELSCCCWLLFHLASGLAQSGQRPFWIWIAFGITRGVQRKRCGTKRQLHLGNLRRFRCDDKKTIPSGLCTSACPSNCPDGLCVANLPS